MNTYGKLFTGILGIVAVGSTGWFNPLTPDNPGWIDRKIGRIENRKRRGRK